MISFGNQPRGARRVATLALLAALLGAAVPAAAQVAAPAHTPGGEVNIKLPSLEQGEFFGLNGHQFLLGGLAVCVLGLCFGLWQIVDVIHILHFVQLRRKLLTALHQSLFAQPRLQTFLPAA